MKKAPLVHMTRFISLKSLLVTTWCGQSKELGELVSTCFVATVTCLNCREMHDYELALHGRKHAASRS